MHLLQLLDVIILTSVPLGPKRGGVRVRPLVDWGSHGSLPRQVMHRVLVRRRLETHRARLAAGMGAAASSERLHTAWLERLRKRLRVDELLLRHRHRGRDWNNDILLLRHGSAARSRHRLCITRLRVIEIHPISNFEFIQR